MRSIFVLATLATLAVSPARAGHISGDCWTAAREGGPCGCEAMKMVGLTDRKYWAVSSWTHFPRATPAIGMAAIWPGRHVEIISAVHGDGTVSTTGSVGFSRVAIGRIMIVNPHKGGAEISKVAQHAIQTANLATQHVARQHAVHYATRRSNHYARRHYQHYAANSRHHDESPMSGLGWGGTS